MSLKDIADQRRILFGIKIILDEIRRSLNIMIIKM